MAHGEMIDVEIDVVKAETERALLIVVSETGKEAWIPRSAIDPECGIDSQGDTGVITIAKFIAIDRGIIEEEE